MAIESFPIDLGTFPLERGDGAGRNSIGIHLQDDAEVAVDLTGYGDTWTAQARRAAGSTTAIDLDVDATGAATGDLIVSVPDDTSAALPSTLVFDVEATGGAISPLTVFKGKFDTEADVTRP